MEKFLAIMFFLSFCSVIVVVVLNLTVFADVEEITEQDITEYL